MKRTLILAGAALLSLTTVPAQAGDTVDHGAYYYDDDYAAYDPYYDDPYYGSYSGGSYDAYYPRYRGKYGRRGKYHRDRRHYTTRGDGIQSPADQGGNRGR